MPRRSAQAGQVGYDRETEGVVDWYKAFKADPSASDKTPTLSSPCHPPPRPKQTNPYLLTPQPSVIMLLFESLSLSLCLLTSVLATPTPQSTSDSDVANPEVPLATTGPEPGNIYLCTGPDFTGTCDVFSAGIGVPGTCWSIPEPYRGNVGSAGPDRGAICRVFDNDKCQGSGYFRGWFPGGNVVEPTKAIWLRCSTCTNCT
ncbi:hypothetical protein QBC39DRAFT_293171 [Podospora conica]|nr:hypothetical protein QBC39DRAFT_293171 [Schizothecium conicum]